MKHFLKWLLAEAPRIGRFIAVGTLATAINAGSFNLFLLAFPDVWYIWWAVVAFFLSYATNFPLQLYWTFPRTNRSDWRVLIILHFSLQVMNVGLETSVLYTLVEFAGVPKPIAQLIGIGFMTPWSFYWTRRIFHH